MSHGETMSLYGRVLALQEVMIHIQKEVNKLKNKYGRQKMGAVKQALIEVDDMVCASLNQGRTLNQTIRDLRTEFNKKGRDNPYLLDEDLIEDKYYQFRGAE